MPESAGNTTRKARPKANRAEDGSSLDDALLNRKAPEFGCPSSSGEPVSLKSSRGSIIVLAFYPRDNTPGCTAENIEFSQARGRFSRAGATVYGISQDSLAAHAKFRDKQGIKHALLSDEDGSVCRRYDVLKMKNMYGKTFEGIERSTFIIDAAGKVRHVWRKVKVPGHVEAVLAACKALVHEA